MVTEDPLILLFPRFVSTEEVAILRRMAEETASSAVGHTLDSDNERWSAEERMLIRRVEDRIGEITGCAPHLEETPLVVLHVACSPVRPPVVQRPRRYPVAPPSRFPRGLHIDTNGDKERRFATSILYLSTPTAGGQTCFPLAAARDPCMEADEQQAALTAARELLQHDVRHAGNTRRPAGAQLHDAAVRAASTYDESGAPRPGVEVITTGRGAAIKAVAGNMVVFWTRHPTGIEERSWHGGELVPSESAADKWAITKFKEIPTSTYADPERCAAFIARSRELALKMQSFNPAVARRSDSLVCRGVA